MIQRLFVMMLKESYSEDGEAKSYDETKTIVTNLNEKKATCKTQNFYD